MILTVTLNPSVDISYPLSTLKIDSVNRVSNVTKTPGGKGLNVTRVLKQLEHPVMATGFLGGANGSFIEEALHRQQIRHQFQDIQEPTRNCIAVLHEGKQTEILEHGPSISKDEQDQFLHMYREMIQDISLVIMSGSLPKGLEDTFYQDMIKIANENHKTAILDCSGSTLKKILEGPNKPYLIKPNIEELASLLNLKYKPSIEDLKMHLSNPIFNGIKWVVVSLGKDGVFAKHDQTFYKVDIPSVDVMNSVGSGDSTIAGFAHAIHHKRSDEEILRTGNTLGILNAMSPQTGHVDLEQFQTIYDSIQVSTVQ